MTQLLILAGSAMRRLSPWAPKAPRATELAPYRQPIVQKIGGMVIVAAV